MKELKELSCPQTISIIHFYYFCDEIQFETWENIRPLYGTIHRNQCDWFILPHLQFYSQNVASESLTMTMCV